MGQTTTTDKTSNSLLIAWQLRDKRVLIVGGGEVASQRVESVLLADAYITILAPVKGLHPRTTELINQNPERITHYDRRFTGPAELHKIDLVLTAIDDVTRSREIVDLCRKARIPVNAADLPDLCDFYFGAQIRDGPLQIMISTNGCGPRMAALVKSKLQDGLTGDEGRAIASVGQIREKLKARAPGVGGVVGRKRMKWMTQLCNTWTLQDFCLLDDDLQEKLLDLGWDQNRIPTLAEITGKRRKLSTTTSLHPSILPSAVGFLLGVACVGLVFYRQK